MTTNNTKRLLRTPDGIIAGVCGGLALSLIHIFLVLFILFHMSMNIVAIISPEAYNMICALLGANWYAPVSYTHLDQKSVIALRLVKRGGLKLNL